jgi:hypothetical protein
MNSSITLYDKSSVNEKRKYNCNSINVATLELSDKLALSFENGWGVAFSCMPCIKDTVEVYQKTLFWLWSNGFPLENIKISKRSMWGIDVLCATLKLSDLIFFLNNLEIYYYINEYGYRWVLPDDVSALNSSIWSINMLKNVLLHV